MQTPRIDALLKWNPGEPESDHVRVFREAVCSLLGTGPEGRKLLERARLETDLEGASAAIDTHSIDPHDAHSDGRGAVRSVI